MRAIPLFVAAGFLIIIAPVAAEDPPLVPSVLAPVWSIVDARGDVIIRHQEREFQAPDAPSRQRDYVDLTALTILEPDDEHIDIMLTNAAGFESGPGPTTTFFRSLHTLTFKPGDAETYANLIIDSYQPGEGADAPLVVDAVTLCATPGRLLDAHCPDKTFVPVRYEAENGNLTLRLPKSSLTRPITEGGLNERLTEGVETWPLRLVAGSELRALQVHANARQILVTGADSRTDPTAVQFVDAMPENGAAASYTLERPATQTRAAPVLVQRTTATRDADTSALPVLVVLAAVLVGLAARRPR